jgi:hypothetical protein
MTIGTTKWVGKRKKEGKGERERERDEKGKR